MADNVIESQKQKKSVGLDLITKRLTVKREKLKLMHKSKQQRAARLDFAVRIGDLQ